ncbi:MAG: LamG-like jellyroll fold domain-containing protein, partial [Promethearchaeota archaeon]
MSRNQLDMNYALPETKKIEQATEFVRIFSEKRREIQNIISSIKRNYKNSGYHISDLELKDVSDDLRAIGRSINNKESRVVPYTDLESREAHDERLFEKYKVEESMQKYVVTDTESKKRAFHKFKAIQRELLRDFFRPHSNEITNLAVKLIKKVIGYHDSIDLVAFIQKKKVLKTFHLKIKGRGLKFSLKRNFFKKELINQQKKLNNDLQKLLTRKKRAESQGKFKVTGILWKLNGLSDILVKPFLKSLPILGLIFSMWFLSFLPEALFFPEEVTTTFLLTPIVFYFSYLVILTKNRILSRSGTTYFLLTSLGLPVVLMVSVLLGWLDFARLFIPLCSLFLSGISIFVSSRQVKVPSRPKEHKILKRIAKTRYHQVKFPMLWFFLFVFTISLCCVFIIAPQWQIIPVACIICSIIFFTIQSKSLKHHYQKKRRLKSRNQGYVSQKQDSYFEPRHARAAYLMLVFLICFPLVFAVNSLVSVERPNMTYAKVPSFNRVQNSVDIDSLEFYSSLEEVESMSINDMFLIQCRVSPFLGEAVKVRVRLTPKNVDPIEGFYLRPYYETSSAFVGGSKYNYNMVTRVPLNTLDLAPGTYQVEIHYSVLTGFSHRSAPVETFDIVLTKDNLEVISNDRFKKPLDAGFYYNAVYTFEDEENNCWTIIFDGQVVDSVHKPVQLDNLQLYIEDSDRYKNIANVSTDSNGRFYLEHTVYGSIEQNLMVKVAHEGSDFYNPLTHKEYAGLETDIYGNRFFIDEDGDGYPDWPYDLYDLFHVLASQSQSQPSGSLAFMAELDENTGINTYDLINNYQGIIQGGTSWDIGKRNFALDFDGDGQIIGGGGETIGTTIYNAYANITYEYDTGGGSTSTAWMSPQSISTVDRSGVDWSNYNNIGEQNNSYASVTLESSGGGGLVPYITSIQQVEIVLTGTSNSANLAVGTVTDNCVPFVSMHITGMNDDWYDIPIDVYFTDGSPPTITVERGGSSGSITASIYIIEFDGTNVDVQHGTFDMTTSETSTTEGLSPSVTTSKTAAVAYHKFTMNGDDDWDHAMVRTQLSSSQLTFDRDNTDSMTLSGHWYTFEAQGTEFSVQDFDITLTTTLPNSDTLSSSVAMNKSMVISSYLANYGSDDGRYGACRVWLSADDTVSADRRLTSSSYNLEIHGFVIEFESSSNILVQRDSISWGTSDASLTKDLSNAVDQTTSIINSPSYYGIMEADGTGGASTECAFRELTFYDDDTIQADRDSGMVGTSNFEVIDFGYGGGSSGNAESDWLRATNFGFNIPTDATIDGIEVRMDRYATNTPQNSIKDYDIRLRNSTGQTGINKASANWWSTTDDGSYDVYGSSSDDWSAFLIDTDIDNDFGVDIAAKTEGVGVTNTAYVDHVEIKIHYTEAIVPVQDYAIIRPTLDVSTEWVASHIGDHADLINETIIDPNDYIYTSSNNPSSVTDEFELSTLDINGGSVTEIQVKVNGKEIDISSTINVYNGTSWLTAKQLNMGSSPSNYTYVWSGLDLTQANLNNTKIRFFSEAPEVVPPTYENFDYVEFGDILDNIGLGTSSFNFSITGWVRPTSFASNQSVNGVKNVFFSKSGIIELGINETGFLQVHILSNSVNATAEYGFPGAIALNTWTFIAVRYNDSGNDVDVLIGDTWCREAIGGVQEPWTGGGALEEGGDLIIGAETSTFSCFTGRLDDISVFNATVTDLELESHRGGAFLEVDSTI